MLFNRTKNCIAWLSEPRELVCAATNIHGANSILFNHKSKNLLAEKLTLNCITLLYFTKQMRRGKIVFDLSLYVALALVRRIEPKSVFFAIILVFVSSNSHKFLECHPASVSVAQTKRHSNVHKQIPLRSYYTWFWIISAIPSLFFSILFLS